MGILIGILYRPLQGAEAPKVIVKLSNYCFEVELRRTGPHG